MVHSPYKKDRVNLLMSLDNPQYDLKVCLSELSKDLKGKMALMKSKTDKCSTPTCTTFKTIHELNVSVKSTGKLCDSANGMKLDGNLVVKELIHGLISDGNGRGYHRGKFEWHDTSGTSVATGVVWGITNAGTHRLPIKDCETCNIKGHMEGRLLGSIISGVLKGCGIYASYVFAFESSKSFQSIDIKGDLEGVVECTCK